MKLTFADRIRVRMCQWFGHKEKRQTTGQSIVCTRCRLLLADPLNIEAYFAQGGSND